MRDREFRELQVSSTQLAIIFLGILIVGVIIFLLGVSVGKKHSPTAKKPEVVAKQEAEPIKEKIVGRSDKPEAEKIKETPEKTISPSKEATSLPTTTAQKEQKPASVTAARAPVEGKAQYYVQVGALNTKEAALSLAQRFSNQGYPVIVLDPFSSDTRTIYRVRVGGFPTREEAEEVKAKLASATSRRTDYFIVRN